MKTRILRIGGYPSPLSDAIPLGSEDLREVFAAGWSTAIAEADFRDDEDADELAATGQILVATFATFLAMSLVAFRLSPKNRTLPSMSRSSSTFPSLSVNLQ